MDGLDIQTRSIGSDQPVTHECLILDTFHVDVNHLTNDDLADLGDACSVTKATRTGRQKEFSFDMWLQRAPEAYLAGTGRGLTPLIIRKLGVNLNTDPETDQDGFVPVTPRILAQLWRYAAPGMFRDRVTEFSGEMIGFLAAARAAKKNGSVNSSAG